VNPAGREPIARAAAVPGIQPRRPHSNRGGTQLPALTDAVRDLSDQARLVLALLHVDGLTEAEAAAALETTPMQVRRIAHEARCRLRATLTRFSADV
jgi:DNA-directed RNA polymerase specialized sigma24 family protein